MNEEQARETEAEQAREEESGDTAEETAAEPQQEAEEHDWDAMTARIDALEQQVQGLAAAMATISAAEDEDGKPGADLPDDEYGAAIDLDDEDLAGMLGL